MLEVLFAENRIEFRSYPFPPASVSSEPAVHFDSIRNIDLSKSPPEIKLKSGEILFVSATQKNALEEFAARFSIPRVVRADVWADLLDPFLDTELSAADQERTMHRLENQGFSREEIGSIRAKVKEPVLRYNSVVWEWVRLGLFDLLEAVHKYSVTDSFGEFYWYSMRIANRATAQE